jgi:hypothetical protein
MAFTTTPWEEFQRPARYLAAGSTSCSNERELFEKQLLRVQTRQVGAYLHKVRMLILVNPGIALSHTGELELRGLPPVRCGVCGRTENEPSGYVPSAGRPVDLMPRDAQFRKSPTD